MVRLQQVVTRYLLPVLTALVVATVTGCASGAKVTIPQGYRLPDQETIYVAPFVNTLVPEAVAEPLFNDFVDNLNRKRNIPGVTFFAIIKDDLKDVDPKWLEKQAYITGEVWSYIENSGCCSTEMRIKSRLNLHQPGQQSPLQIFIPKEVFFEHERSTIDDERKKFIHDLAEDLANQMLKMLGRLS